MFKNCVSLSHRSRSITIDNCASSTYHSSLCYICAFLHVFCIILPYFGNSFIRFQRVDLLEKCISCLFSAIYQLEESITDTGHADID